MDPSIEYANEQQLRFLVALYTQVGIAYDPTELATLSKWEAAERINLLRGRRAASTEKLDQALLEIVQLRQEALGEE
jgi:hypothetical protein